MLKATWRRLGSPAWLVIGLFTLSPSMAEAQLFPNRTIRRERPPCSSEPPFNAQVRRDYFGYYPTCWSRFPAGWACPCPNPELPNMAESVKNVGEIGKPRNSAIGGPRPGPEDANPANPDDGMVPNPAGEGRDIPLPNPGRSPFDLDPSPKPPGSDATPAPKPPASGGRPGTSAGLMEMPRLPATTPTASTEALSRPGSITMAPEEILTSSDAPDPRPDLGPLPSAPQTLPAGSMPSAAPSTYPVVGTPAPAQAPRRRGFLSSLFGGNTRNR